MTSSLCISIFLLAYKSPSLGSSAASAFEILDWERALLSWEKDKLYKMEKRSSVYIACLALSYYL